MMQRFPRSKLFVGGLSHDTTDGSLLAYFEQFGDVASAEVLRDHQTLNSRGFGFVTYVEEYIAQKVIKTGFTSPHIVDGKQVEVKVAVPKDLKQMEEAALQIPHSHNRNHSVASFNSLPSDRAFMNEIYQPAQRSRSVSAVKYQPMNDPDYCSGNLFQVPMLTPENARMRFKERSPTSVSSYSSTSMYSMNSPLQRVCSMPAMRYPNAPSSQCRLGSNLVANKIFVGGLLYATGHESLRSYFNRFGEIESAEVIYNRETKKSRGFGFVIFKHHESLKKVLFHQQTEPLTIDGKQIEIKLCKPREECIYEQQQGMGLQHNFDAVMEDEIYTMRRHSFEEYKKDTDYATDLLGEFNQLGLDEFGYDIHDDDAFLSPLSKLNSAHSLAGEPSHFPLNPGAGVDRDTLLMPKGRGYYDPLSDQRRFEAFSPKYDSSERLPCIFESERST